MGRGGGMIVCIALLVLRSRWWNEVGGGTDGGTNAVKGAFENHHKA